MRTSPHPAKTRAATPPITDTSKDPVVGEVQSGIARVATGGASAFVADERITRLGARGKRAGFLTSARAAGQVTHMFIDPGAQEYATNQAREEARHVNAFSHYVRARFGVPIKYGLKRWGVPARGEVSPGNEHPRPLSLLGVRRRTRSDCCAGCGVRSSNAG